MSTFDLAYKSTTELAASDAIVDGDYFLTVDSTTGAITKATAAQLATYMEAGELDPLTVTSTNASALAVGRQGATAPVLKVNANTASVATGIEIVGAAAAGGVAVSAISSGTNENLTIDAKGSGTISLGATSTGNIVVARPIVGAGAITTSDSTAVSGYATGAGGAVTQITDATTGVTLSKPCGQITTVALTTAAAGEERFTVTNTLVAATDCIVLSTTYNGAGTPMLSVQKVAAGAFDIVITNVHAANAFNAVMVINFAVIKAVAA